MPKLCRLDTVLSRATWIKWLRDTIPLVCCHYILVQYSVIMAGDLAGGQNWVKSREARLFGGKNTVVLTGKVQRWVAKTKVKWHEFYIKRLLFPSVFYWYYLQDGCACGWHQILVLVQRVLYGTLLWKGHKLQSIVCTCPKRASKKKQTLSPSIRKSADYMIYDS